MKQKELRIGFCGTCGGNLGYTEEEMAYDMNVLEGKCYCDSGKKMKDCHPEYHYPDCAMCECAGEIQD